MRFAGIPPAHQSISTLRVSEMSFLKMLVVAAIKTGLPRLRENSNDHIREFTRKSAAAQIRAEALTLQLSSLNIHRGCRFLFDYLGKGASEDSFLIKIGAKNHLYRFSRKRAIFFNVIAANINFVAVRAIGNNEIGRRRRSPRMRRISLPLMRRFPLPRTSSLFLVAILFHLKIFFIFCVFKNFEKIEFYKN